jgi:hypothetical protein
MGAIMIKADGPSSKILKDLAKQLGATVTTVKDEQYEDLLLGNLMDAAKTGTTVSKDEVFKKLKAR